MDGPRIEVTELLTAPHIGSAVRRETLGGQSRGSPQVSLSLSGGRSIKRQPSQMARVSFLCGSSSFLTISPMIDITPAPPAMVIDDAFAVFWTTKSITDMAIWRPRNSLPNCE